MRQRSTEDGRSRGGRGRRARQGAHVEQRRRLALGDALLEGALPSWERLAVFIDSEPEPDPDRVGATPHEPPMDFAPDSRDGFMD